MPPISPAFSITRKSGGCRLAGVSIGGYVLFEFWRRYRGRVAALALCNTKAPADSPEARAGRLQAAADVLERGTEPFFESMVPKLIGQDHPRAAVPTWWMARCA